MGNCVSANSLEINAPKITVVQAVEGRVLEMEVPILQDSIKVGELMLEFPPGHFVAHLDKADFLATTGKRATPLGADGDAKPGAVYVLLPMPRLHTRITPQELLTFAKLLHLHDQHHFAKAASKVASLKPQVHRLFTAGGARVAPLSEEDFKDDTLNGVEQATTLFKMQQADDQQQEEPAIYSSSAFISSQCHGLQIQVIKSKPWAPKLQTIQES